MKIAICSDTHDNHEAIKVFLNFCYTNKIKTLFHCGDWTTPETIELFRKNFSGSIYGVLGNATINESVMLNTAKNLDITLKKLLLEITIEDISFAIVHKPKKAKELAKKGRHAMIYYGHTHKPWIETINNVSVVNPGTLSGMFAHGTFAVFNTVTHKLDLIPLMTLYDA